MKMWWGQRVGRGDFLFALIVLNVAYLALAYFVFEFVDFNLQIGLRSSPSVWGQEPVVFTVMKIVFDLLIVSLCYRRLQDANIPGWSILLWAAGVWILATMGLSAVSGVLAIGGLLALFFLKPTVGPNRFGADPRGWKSPEHLREFQERLKNEP